MTKNTRKDSVKFQVEDISKFHQIMMQTIKIPLKNHHSNPPIYVIEPKKLYMNKVVLKKKSNQSYLWWEKMAQLD